MNSIFLIKFGSYYDWTTDGYFLTEEEAKDFCDLNNPKLKEKYFADNPDEIGVEFIFIPYEHYCYQELKIMKK